MRVCISASDSPPGNRARDGARCTVFQRSVLASSGELAAGPLAVVGLDHPRERLHGEPVVLRDRLRGLGGALDRAGVDDRDRERRPAARRAPSAWSRPLSERSMPGARPESIGPVWAVTAWRASTSRVGLRVLRRRRGLRRRLGLEVGLGVRRSLPEFYRRAPYLLPVTDQPISLLTAGLPADRARPRARRRARRASPRRSRSRTLPGATRSPRWWRRWPRFLDGWARLGQLARDPVEGYACFRVGYHRGLDRLRQSGWRGSGLRALGAPDQPRLPPCARRAACERGDHRRGRRGGPLRRVPPPARTGVGPHRPHRRGRGTGHEARARSPASPARTAATSPASWPARATRCSA